MGADRTGEMADQRKSVTYRDERDRADDGGVDSPEVGKRTRCEAGVLSGEGKESGGDARAARRCCGERRGGGVEGGEKEDRGRGRADRAGEERAT